MILLISVANVITRFIYCANIVSRSELNDILKILCTD